MEAGRTRHLFTVDADTGESLDECPTCAEWARKYNGVLSQLGTLRADKEVEARRNGKWPEALAIFRYWQDLTDHETAEFSADRFWIVEPHLTRAEKRGADGATLCRSAIRGLCASDFHMKRGRYANRDGGRHDEFWRPFQTSASARGPSQDQLEKWIALDPERGAIPSATQATLIEHAKKIAGRVLERARLIEHESDPVVVAHLLLEVDRLNREWLRKPLEADR